MKIRSVRPEFFTDAKMAQLSAHARLLYMAMWCMADDEGRGRYLPKTIEGEAFPHEPVDIVSLLGELEELGRIVVYEVEGEQFFYVPKLADYQKPNRPVASRLPAPTESAPRQQCASSDHALREQCTRTAQAPLGEGVVEGEGEGAIASDRKRATPAPATFEVTEDLGTWAARKGISADLTEETERFLDYHRAKGSAFKDWRAAWRNWMSRADAFAPRQTNGPGPMPGRVIET